MFTRVIEKNSTIPTSKTQIFSTASDNQTSVEVHVLQGEREMSIDNKTLARFILDGIPPAPRGVPQVEVTFDVDANGILSVKAADKATGKSQSVRIEATTSLSKEEVERLKHEAESYAEEDRKKRELTEMKNRGETLVYTAEKALTDVGDKVPEEVKTSVKEKIEALKSALNGVDGEAIEREIKNLNDEIQKIGSSMYNQNNAGGEAENQSQGDVSPQDPQP